jgi:hypothetical protein
LISAKTIVEEGYHLSTRIDGNDNVAVGESAVYVQHRKTNGYPNGGSDGIRDGC